jgi:hypothetical protein
MLELCYHLIIDAPLEWDDEAGKVAHRLPIPCIELSRMAARRRVDLDLVFAAFKTEGEPALSLASVP